MASTYSPSLRLELMATGDQSGTWGDTTNTNLGTLLEQSITGYLSKAMADANQTLTSLNGATDEARNMIVEATGALTAGRNMVVPTAEKLYLIKNSTTGGFAVTVKTTAGTGVAVPMNGSRWVYCDGTNVVDGQSGPLTPTTSDSAALGTSALMWSDLFLASGGVINWNNGALTLTQSTETLTQTFTDAGATVGPVYDLYRDSSTPAVNDILGRVIFNGRDSAANKQEYGSIEGVIADPTSTSEDGALDFYATIAGTRTRVISVGPNLDLAAIGQIKFPATQNPSSDANTLDDYEEGSWTPADGSGAALSLTSVSGSYVKVGRMVNVWGAFTYPVTASGANAVISGLPFATNNGSGGASGTITYCSSATPRFFLSTVNASTIALYGSTGAPVTNANLSTVTFVVHVAYLAAS